MNKQRQAQQQALNAIRKGLAMRMRVLVAHDACPICRRFEGAYDFDDVPNLPLEGCLRFGGCNAVYAPVMDRFGP
ncbi:MAG: hypothetical protein R3E31_04120 [Chloroflexota bacterium]